MIDLRLGDCLEVLKTLEDNSVDSIVTDPPYGIGFMNKEWDDPKKHKELIDRETKRAQERFEEGKSPVKGGFSKGVQPGLKIGGAKEGKWFQEWCELWAQECFRVLKPGGYILSFSAPRTYHRMATAFEDVGFQIRDQIMWVFGSGFPKSHNIGKAIDKRGGESIGWFGEWLKKWRNDNEIPQSQIAELFPSKTGGLTGCVSNWELGNNLPTNEQFNLICETFDLPFKSLEEAEREFIGTKTSGIGKAFTKDGWGSGHDEVEITKGNSEWEGWGTALKPAHEPICMARKPLSEKSIAENVLKHGTGGINIDGCRIPFDMTDTNPATNPLYRQENKYKMPEPGQESNGAVSFTSSKNEISQEGRFPANIIFDEEAGKILDKQSGISKSTKRKNPSNTISKPNIDFGGGLKFNNEHNDTGGASRFFYCPKVSKKERNAGMEGMIEIFTPTIKLVYLLENNVWEKEDLKIELADTDKSLQKVIDEYIIMEDNKWNIGSFGNYIMEQFQKEHKSITETEINSTTILETLNSWIQNHTKTYIAELFGEMVKDIKFVEDANKKSTTLNIILQKKDGYSQSVKNVELKGLWSINIAQSKSSHPTVKPIALMEYLITLVTPKGGVVLEPFMGSGSTGIAAKNLGMSFIGIEKEEEYFEIAKQRINGN